ncbi:MAG: histidine phosphatase family protein [Pseudomonadota bacterium]
MTRRLILMRHAKSSWDNSQLSDHDRPLNARGRRSAEVLGDWLRARDLQPGEIFCSTARRTVETLERLGLKAAVHLDARLYHASPETMLSVLREAAAGTILMVGHNPGMAEFAQRIVTAPPEHDRFSGYPTGATLSVRVAAQDWAAMDWSTGEVEDFVIPRELT